MEALEMSINTFNLGDCVVYGTNGICVIEEIAEMSFITGAPKSMYYTLNPVNNNGSAIYIPADNEKLMGKMRKLMTKDEIDELLTGMRDKELAWENDRRFRSENFHEIMVQGVTQDLLLMIRCIYLKKHELIADGKKLNVTDSNILKAAEKLVEEEFSCVLGIDHDEVGDYIRKLISK